MVSSPNAIEIPEMFICPLTLEIMSDPVMNRAGQTYERAAIVEWLKQDIATCPMTRRPIMISDFVANHRLRKQIQNWIQEQGDMQKDGIVEPGSDHQCDNPLVFRKLKSLKQYEVERGASGGRRPKIYATLQKRLF
jgi:U-box domain